MYLELYQQETEKIATRNGELLEELSSKLAVSSEISVIEEQAMLHSLQIMIENAIGKARHILKAKDKHVPVSAYELFEQLGEYGLLNTHAQQEWKKIIGLRNTIVHEYMKVNIELVKSIVKNEQYDFVLDFLNSPFSTYLNNA